MNSDMKIIITRQPCNKDIEILGHVYHGIQDVKNQCQSDSGPLVILENSQRFPCFDYEDYATETRFFRNFLFCKSNEEAARKGDILRKCEVRAANYCLIGEEMSEEMLPMVYYEDEKKELVIAKKG